MNDFEWDVLQKKRIANSARRMKRGSKSRKCSLPSDHMTQAEWKRRNGKVSTYNLNQPMTWVEFKQMPLDLQQQYLDGLQQKFNVPLPKISTDMFRLKYTSLSVYCRRHKLHGINMRGKGLNFAENTRWLDWLNGVVPVTAEEPTGDILVGEAISEEPAVEVETLPEESGVVETPEELDYPEVETEVEEAITLESTDENDFEMTDMAATFKGEYSTEKFLHWVSRLPLVEGRRVKIFMEIETL